MKGDKGSALVLLLAIVAVVSAVLEPEQKKKLGRVKPDDLGVHTSYDPFAEYTRESLR